MANKKRRKKVAPQRSNAGRKKELKRFELEKWSGGDASDDVLATNQIAFIVTTSGGTPLNTTDVNKLWRILQHELRALGHKLKRKGQPLDPPEKKLKVVEPPTDNNVVEEKSEETAPPEASSPDGDLTGSPYSLPAKPQIADLADPDDPHPNQ